MKNDTTDNRLTAVSIGNEPQMSAEESERKLAELRALRAETAGRMAEVEAALARQKEASGGE